MFNSKAIQKEMESNHKTVLSDSSITKIWKIWDIRMQIQQMTQTFKSSDGGQRKWTKESSLANWNNAIYSDEAAFYRGDVTHKKWVSVSEEHSAKITRAKFKCNVFGWIHITGILTFELFEGGFNSDKFLDILKRNLKFIKQAWKKNVLLVADNWSMNKYGAVKEFYMKNTIRSIEWPSYSLDLNPI